MKPRCDLCAERGIDELAVTDLLIPGTGGTWANVCAADAERARSRLRAEARVLAAFMKRAAPTRDELVAMRAFEEARLAS